MKKLEKLGSSPPREHRVYPFQCSKDPRNRAKTIFFYRIYYDKTACTPCMSSYTAMYWDIQLYTHKYCYILVYTVIYLHILICTHTYCYILRETFNYYYILWYTGIYYSNNVYTRIYLYVLCISVYILYTTEYLTQELPWDLDLSFSWNRRLLFISRCTLFRKQCYCHQPIYTN